MDSEQRLGVISSIRPGQKLFVSDPGRPYVSTNGLGVTRLLWRETRDSTLRYLVGLAAECEAYKDSVSTRTMENAIAGLENLKETYRSDRMMCMGITSVQSRLLDILAPFAVVTTLAPAVTGMTTDTISEIAVPSEPDDAGEESDTADEDYDNSNGVFSAACSERRSFKYHKRSKKRRIKVH